MSLLPSLRCFSHLVLGLMLPVVVFAADTPPVPLKLNPELSDPGRPARTRSERYRGWVIDAVLHTAPDGYNESNLPGILEKSKVMGAVVMPTPNDGLSNRGSALASTEQKLRLAGLAPDEVRILCGGDYLTNLLSDAQAFGRVTDLLTQRLQRLAQDLGNTPCLGVGELGLMHFNKLGDQNVTYIRPDFPPLLEVVDLVGQRGGWIQLHAEPRDPAGDVSHHAELAQALAVWTARQPRLRIMLSHTGMTSAANARLILQSYPQVTMSIKLTSANVSTWRHLEPVLNANGELYEDWAQLMEEMPERFVIGSDAKFGGALKHSAGNETAYPQIISRFHRMLGSLEPAAARKIAQGNARRLFGFPERKSAVEANEAEAETGAAR
ncbi:hypothetical protein ACLBKS_00305 [Hylemonella sp. W303a]|uniref:hypothetical protein n=1 Tax=Hylemonella sp. W303a TaxID=3389873 RepID=UPI00396AFFD9